MTTYRIRPLVWTANRNDRAEFWANPVWAVVYAIRTDKGLWYTPGTAPYGPYESKGAAIAACESHWRGLLSAALEPVAILPTLTRLREHLVLMMQYGYDDGELSALDGLIASLNPTP